MTSRDEPRHRARPVGGGRGSAAESSNVARRDLVLRAVDEHPGGIDTAGLAGLLGLHPNTVRFHLDHLVRAGLVTASRDATRRSGRPRLIFASVQRPPPAPGDAPSGPVTDGYAQLAAALVKHLATTAENPGEEAQEAGRSWAADIFVADERAKPRSERESLAAVVSLFDDLGFAPEATPDQAGTRILLHQCPFYALAVSNPAIVCGLHLGLLQGTIDRLGHRGSSARLRPFIAPALCDVFVPGLA